ncbi:MAG: efflux RND transporter permease subunit [Alphaproteobacteria bacterium]|nr:efflux RND transporter permease subunit [Alphaproteobacteria bacterium]
MIISDTCIKRPVFATVINLFLILIGVVSFQRLSVREYPKIDEPVVTVETHYLGASAAIIESQVTKPLEESLAGIDGIEVMSSISRSEQSQITVRFKLVIEPDAAAADVRDRVARVRKMLPDEIDEPVISKVEADAQPILYLAFFSDRHSQMAISDFADRYVKDRVQNVTGVASATIVGERKKSMRIWLDPQQLAAFQLTPADVENALRKQNIEIPAGRIESSKREFTVLSETDLQTPKQFEAIIIKQNGDSFVRIGQVGKAEVAPEDERKVVRFNGHNAVALGIIKQATANPLEVSQGIRNLIPKIQASLPQGMRLAIAYDTSIFIDRSIKAVYHTIIEAIVLVLCVIFLFLRNVRSTLIPMVTIPISLIGVFVVMFMLGYTINTLTLLAMVLAIGLVVDDAIVMLENIYRHMEEGMPAMQAAYKGSREIAFAVIAMTITLAAVYAPIAFTEGKTGRLFIEFALTLAGSVIISGFIALTLTPMMCSRLLKYETRHGKAYTLVEESLKRLTNGYEKLLTWALHHHAFILMIGVAVAGSGVVFGTLLKSELAPVEDRGNIVTVTTAPEGATIDYMTDWMTNLEPIFKATPEVDTYFVVAGSPTVSQGIAFARLKPWEERHKTQQELTKEFTPKIVGALTGIMGFPTNPPSLGASIRSKPVQMELLTNGTYEELDGYISKILEAASKNPGLTNVDSNLKLNKPQLSILVDRDKVASVGVDIDELGRTLETMLGGRQVTRYKDGGKEYKVIVQTSDQKRERPQDLADIYIRSKSGEMIKLSNVLTIDEAVAPRQLDHFNQLRSAEVTASLAPGYTVGDALTYLEDKAREIIPSTMLIDYDGQSREFKQTSSSILTVFLLALMFIFLVLAAQFESWVSPFIILLTVPLSIAGALMVLYFAGGTLNVYSKVGLVTLIGLITKHGILIVEFANQHRHQGLDAYHAILHSAKLRLRPILMTTGAMVLGALPLVISHGAGAESRQQIGWVIIGGMSVGTLFTLFVIPVVYQLMARFTRVEEELK